MQAKYGLKFYLKIPRFAFIAIDFSIKIIYNYFIDEKQLIMPIGCAD